MAFGKVVNSVATLLFFLPAKISPVPEVVPFDSESG